jgi:hypothetical protein
MKIEMIELIKNVLLSNEDSYICTTMNQYGSSIVKFQLRVISLKNYFIQRSFLYGSILLGLPCLIFMKKFHL